VSKAAFISILLAALAFRLILIATSFGSTDALLMMSWAHIAERFGVPRAYLYAQYLNHPPLALWIAATADRVGRLIGLEFPDIFRLLQTIADVVTAAILYKMSKSREIVAFFFASPAAIFLSGFHSNSDPTMIALLVASVWIASRSAAGSGALLGASGSIKIAPLPLAPFFLLQMSWARRLLFVVLLCASVVIPYIPVVRISGWIAIRNIFGYSGSGYEWGFCGIGFLMRNRPFAEFYSHNGRFIVIVALALLFIFYWKRPAPLTAMIGVALLAMNFFAPGFGVQYLVWPLPFLLFALPRQLAYALNAALSLFLFATYTLWSGEFPWWFANAASPDINRRLIALLAFPLWLLYGVAIVAALRRQSPGQLAAQELAEGGAGD
jgi:hypothetical protein